MSTNETKRVPNFSPAEKQFLIHLIAQKYAGVLEDKKTNRISIGDKNTTWKQIEEEFNSSGPLICYRSAESLQRLYANKKKDLRKKMAEEKKQRFATGGGIMPIVKQDDTDEILISIVNRKTIEGFENKFDNDSEVTAISTKSQTEEGTDNTIFVYTADDNCQESETRPVSENVSFEYIQTDNMYNVPNLNTDSAVQWGDSDPKETTTFPKQNNTWKKYKTADLQSPLNPVLNVRNVRTTSGSQDLSTPTSSLKRKRPNTSTIRTLTSSHIAEKYNVLVDKRLVLVEKQIRQIEDRYSYDREKEKLEIQTLKNKEHTEKLKQKKLMLEIELLKLEIAKKK